MTAPSGRRAHRPRTTSFPSASVSSRPPVIGPGLVGNDASVEETMPLLIHGLVSLGRLRPEDPDAVARRARHLGERHRAQRAFCAASSTSPVTSSRPTTCRVDDVAVGRRHLDRSRRRRRRCVLVRISPLWRTQTPLACRCPSPSLTVTITSPAPRSRRAGDTAASFGANTSTGGGVGVVVVAAEGAEQAEHTDGDDRAERAGRQRGDQRGSIRAFVRDGRADRAQLGRVHPDAIHPVRRRAARTVVLGPQRIVVDDRRDRRWPSWSSSPPGPIVASVTT